MDRRRYVIIK